MRDLFIRSYMTCSYFGCGYIVTNFKSLLEIEYSKTTKTYHIFENYAQRKLSYQSWKSETYILGCLIPPTGQVGLNITHNTT